MTDRGVNYYSTLNSLIGRSNEREKIYVLIDTTSGGIMHSHRMSETDITGLKLRVNAPEPCIFNQQGNTDSFHEHGPS